MLWSKDLVFFEKNYDQKVSTTTIYKGLSEKYQLRSKWQKKTPRGAVSKADAARQVIQMDTVNLTPSIQH